MQKLDRLEAGQRILVDGDHFVAVTADLAAVFGPGDRVFVDREAGELLHVTGQESVVARQAISDALDAWQQVKEAGVEARKRFFRVAADRLADDTLWSAIEGANRRDVAVALERQRSTTRLALSDATRALMIEGLAGWAERVVPVAVEIGGTQTSRGRVDLFRSPLGLVAFVFEGRPNVLVDACGVLATGNAAVLRIGSDALGTAEVCMEQVIRPALDEAGLPRHSIHLLSSSSHAAAWALFADPRLALAVARGSGPTTRLLGAIAEQAGNPVSMHGTGGAWIFATPSAGPDELTNALVESLDRKVCNTANTCCLVGPDANHLGPAVVEGLHRAAGKRGPGVGFVAHVAAGSERCFPIGEVPGGSFRSLDPDHLGREWEWENAPEVTLLVVDSLAAGAELFNRWSPRFVASLVSADASEHEHFFRSIDSPFVGDGYTRWVDGQFALDRPELGLSNWEGGRLFGRGGILSGEDIYTVRARFRSDR